MERDQNYILSVFIFFLSCLFYILFLYLAEVPKGGRTSGDGRGDGDVHRDPAGSQPSGHHPASPGVHRDRQQNPHQGCVDDEKSQIFMIA